MPALATYPPVRGGESFKTMVHEVVNYSYYNTNRRSPSNNQSVACTNMRRINTVRSINKRALMDLVTHQRLATYDQEPLGNITFPYRFQLKESFEATSMVEKVFGNRRPVKYEKFVEFSTITKWIIVKARMRLLNGAVVCELECTASFLPKVEIKLSEVRLSPVQKTKQQQADKMLSYIDGRGSTPSAEVMNAQAARDVEEANRLKAESVEESVEEEVPGVPCVEEEVPEVPCVEEEVPEVPCVEEEVPEVPCVEESVEEEVPCVEENVEEEVPCVEENVEEEVPCVEENVEEEVPRIEEDSIESNNENSAITSEDDVEMTGNEEIHLIQLYESTRIASGQTASIENIYYFTILLMNERDIPLRIGMSTCGEKREKMNNILSLTKQTLSIMRETAEGRIVLGLTREKYERVCSRETTDITESSLNARAEVQIGVIYGMEQERHEASARTLVEESEVCELKSEKEIKKNVKVEVMDEQTKSTQAKGKKREDERKAKRGKKTEEEKKKIGTGPITQDDVLTRASSKRERRRKGNQKSSKALVEG